MKRYIKMKELFLIALVTCVVSWPLQAGQLPDYYPGLFSVMGTLERLATNEGVVVIADQEVRLQGRVIVHTPDTRYGTLNLLHKGMQVGANPDRNGNIQEIWVLPADFHPTMNTIPLAR